MSEVQSLDNKARDIFLIRPVRDSTPKIDAAVAAYIASMEAKGKTVYDPKDQTVQTDSVGLNICEQNRDAIRNASEVHVYWTPGSEGSCFDIGMAFMEDKPIFLANKGAVPEARNPSLQNLVLGLDNIYRNGQCVPEVGLLQNQDVFVVCPIICFDLPGSLELHKQVKAMENSGKEVYFPPRDTRSENYMRINYLGAHKTAILQSELVKVYWTTTWRDNKFDLGMAFMAEKPISLVTDIPATPGKKSFNNVLLALDAKYKKTE